MNFTTLLAIAQQSEYDLTYIEQWYKKHKDEEILIQPEQWTLKLKLFSAIGQFLFFLNPLMRIKVGLLLLQPSTYLAQSLLRFMATVKLRWLQSRGLTVIAIAGSYGKTSTKHHLAYLLKNDFAVLSTAQSVNTPIGLALTILKQLKNSHQVFIAELGEYHQGDITDLAHFIKPKYGIVTPVGQQHLERMGSLENIAKTIGELIEHFDDKKNVSIADVNRDFFDQNLPNWYGEKKESNILLSHTKVAWQGTEFDIEMDNSKIHVFTPLLGKSQVVNLLPTFWIAQQLDTDIQKIAQRCATLPYVERRHQPMFLENSLNILDNSYNTNPQSAQESLELISQLSAKRRIVITLGFVELGKESEKIHFEFGQKLAKYADYIGILTSSWSEAIVEGFLKAGGKKDHIVIAKNQEDAMQQLKQFVIPETLILFEGGFQEKYV